MGERLSAVLGAVGALCVVVLLLNPGAGNQPDEVSRPLSTDRHDAGLWALARWAEEAGISTWSLRERYHTLDAIPGMPARGNLLLITLPQRHQARFLERRELVRWVEAGNTALVLVAGGGRPDWLAQTDLGGDDGLLEEFGFELEAVYREETEREAAEAEAADRTSAETSGDAGDAAQDAEEGGSFADAIESSPVTLLPALDHPLTDGVRAVEVNHLWWLPDRKLESEPPGRAWLALLKLEGGDAEAFWEARAGAGRLWVGSYAALVSNSHIGVADNARFAANLLALGRDPDGWLVFDDMHQGLSALYDPEAFFGDPRLWWTVAFMLAIWLAWVVGRAQRLSRSWAPEQRARSTDFARAVGGLLARRLTVRGAARTLLEHFFEDLRARHLGWATRLDDWQLLARVYHGPPGEVGVLRAAARRVDDGKRVNLAAFARTLERVREGTL